MPLPSDLSVITVTATYEAIDGSLATGGKVTFDPGTLITDNAGLAIFGAPASAVITGGTISIDLPCTDNPDLNPTGFSYTVTEDVNGWPARTYTIQLPSTLGPTVDLSQLASVAEPPEPEQQAGGDLNGQYPDPFVISTHLAAPLPVIQGGTGLDAAGEAGTVLTADGQGGTEWAPAGTSDAGGDLSGSYPDPAVIQTHLAAPLPVAQGGTGLDAAGEAGTVLTADGQGGMDWQEPAVSGTAVVRPSWDPEGAYTLQFEDDFDADSLDGTHWGAGWQNATGVTGPINTSETAAYSDANVSVADSCLNLALTATSVKSGYANTGACVTSNPNGSGGSEGFAFTYGAAEARVYLPPAPDGAQIANWPAFWLDGQSWPQDGEIDIVEGLSGLAQQHFHFANSAGTAEDNGGPACVPEPAACSGWHTFGVNWTADQIDYYYDGQLVRTITGGITGQPMYLVFDNTAGTYGGPTVTGDAGTMMVDWVRVWSPGPAAPLSAAAELRDAFNDPVSLQTMWGGGSNIGAQAVIGEGRAVLPADADYDYLESGRPCSIAGSALWAQVTPAQSADAQTWIGLVSGVPMDSGDDENSLNWTYQQQTGTLVASIVQSAVSTTIATLTYDPQAHAWWRIREESGTVYWDTSADGNTWTQQGSAAYEAGFPVTRLYADLGAGTWGTVTSDVSVFQNLNMPPPSRIAKVLPAAFTSASGTTAQNVKGMSVYLPAGVHKVRAWAPILPSGTTGSTQKLAWTFSGTASAALAAWRCTGASSVTWAQSASLTSAFTTPTMVAAGYEIEWEAYVRVTVPGILQLTTTPTTSGDNVQFPAGCSIEARPAVF